MEVGEKFLTIKVLGSIDLKAFPNKSENPQAPKYKGDGVAVWVNEKKAPVSATEAPIVQAADTL